MQSGYNKFDMPPRSAISTGNSSSSKDALPTLPILPYSTTSYTVQPLLVDLGTCHSLNIVVRSPKFIWAPETP
jgi:hypothetical protein